MSPSQYATVTELRAWNTMLDNDRDDILVTTLCAASSWVDEYCGRRFGLDETATTRSYATRGRTMAGVFLVDDIGSSDGLVVESGTTASGFTAVTGVEYGPLNALAQDRPIESLYLAAGWPEYSSTLVRVTARWGWPAVPDAVSMATLIQAARLYKRKDAAEGIINSAEWGAVRMSRIDPDVASLLAPYRFLQVA